MVLDKCDSIIIATFKNCVSAGGDFEAEGIDQTSFFRGATLMYEWLKAMGVNFED